MRLAVPISLISAYGWRVVGSADLMMYFHKIHELLPLGTPILLVEVKTDGTREEAAFNQGFLPAVGGLVGVVVSSLWTGKWLLRGM